MAALYLLELYLTIKFVVPQKSIHAKDNFYNTTLDE